eukprot:1935165-Amphidinium_carterae.1
MKQVNGALPAKGTRLVGKLAGGSSVGEVVVLVLDAVLSEDFVLVDGFDNIEDVAADHVVHVEVDVI